MTSFLKIVQATERNKENEDPYDTYYCKKLLFNIIKRAILDISGACPYRKTAYVSQTSRSEALTWIMSDTYHEPGSPNSYKHICELLGIDYRWLRNPEVREKVIRYFQQEKKEGDNE